jgi:iron-sulfur cluster assembly accessory protein
MITVTDNAVKHLSDLLHNKDAGSGLRLGVHRGGCAGMEYIMKVDQPALEDQIFADSGVNIIVDRESLDFLDGACIDYQESLNDSGFKVLNPNAARSCGCGTSFEPKAN